MYTKLKLYRQRKRCEWAVLDLQIARRLNKITEKVLPQFTNVCKKKRSINSHTGNNREECSILLETKLMKFTL